ncbi:MAG: AraC family transcriptional regulator [Mangrovicoccus sp.]|nr:AraC family transcriptional regulator [Mangrovicoccus sp.]
MPHRYRPRIVASTLSDPFRIIENANGSAQEICGLAGIGSDELQDTLGLRKFVDFCEMAAAHLHMPEFGWRVGAIFDLNNLGYLGGLIQEAPTLGAAFTLFKNAFAIIQSDSELTLKVDDDKARLSYRILDLDIWPRQQDAELTLSVLLNLLRSAAGPEFQPDQITLEHTGSSIWQAADLNLRCPVICGAGNNSLRFPARILDLPMNPVATDHFKLISTQLMEEARAREREAPTTIRVRRALVNRLGHGKVNQTEVAQSLGMSRRTLRRKLELENRSFSDLLSDCQTRYAQRLLHESREPLAAIAMELGYSEVSAFERAFKKAQGLTPRQYREFCSQTS